VLKVLTKIRHPYIIPIEHIIANENGCLVIQKFCPSGSLKDVLCASSPLNPFNSKYGNPKGRLQLPQADIALYSRQILEAIKYLHSIGLAHGEL
jgi:PX domain-containing protein kinase-like protein